MSKQYDPSTLFARVSIEGGRCFGAFRDGAADTVTDLCISAERAGLICGSPWDCGSVPVYQSEDERDADKDGMCKILIRVDNRWDD